MRLKSYFAGTVEAAVELARQELGPDALLVNSRKATPEARYLGEYEVVFAAAPPASEPEQAGAKKAGATPGIAAPSHFPQVRDASVDRLTQDVADLKRELERVASALSRSPVVSGPSSYAEPEWSGLFARLISAEVNAELARTIVERLSRKHRVAGPEADSFEAELSGELEACFPVDATLGRRGATRRVAALVGPPGCGKTTTLAKLAATYGLTSRRPTQILSADVYRIGAADQLRSYAAILGVGIQVLETTIALSQALEEHRHKELVLIDTAGLARNDMEDATELARFLSTHPEIDTHLVLPASMKPSDLTRVVERFECFHPGKLLFTHLDETEHFGALVSEASRTGKPISFLCSGQQVPEDLAEASRPLIAGLVLGRQTGLPFRESAVAA